MRKIFSTILASGALALAVAVSGCGGGTQVDSKSAGSSSETVTGVASTGAPAAGTVSLKDSSTPAKEQTTATSGTGAFSFNTAGMTAPYVLKAEWAGRQAGPLYSLAPANGRTNINTVTNAAVAAASEEDGIGADILYNSPDRERHRGTHIRFREIIEQLRVVLAPLFALYEATGDPVSDDDDDDDDDNNENDNTGLQALLRDVSIVVQNHKVVVTNRSTGGLIYEAPLNDIGSGTFHPENMPGTTTPPGACTYTYSSWGACQSDNTQSRTVLTSTPAGCTGTPVLTQSCTYAPPACTYNYSSWGACQSDNTQSRTLLSSSPAGCTGTPVLTQSCTYTPPAPGACTSFTYSAWGACQSDNTQTRTVVSSLPAGCTGGTPVLTQACTYTPPPPACGSCHAIPPATGQHAFHASRMSCSSCHGSGYSTTTTNAATHMNGVRDVMASLNWNATAQTCAPACHGSRSW